MACLYNARTQSKILDLSEIIDHDVLIATTDYDLDPFQEEKKIRLQESLNRKGG